ncbi:extracellular solute-binding protein [Paucisalibacillus sp. EB02]|uniref:extracellular solute-binding protein n=1 Tax=Paucisalibacillus sp. EB02 TaxID=1347087 RepID=UPI0004B7A29B|nr:extracellular solute-binding protein [Paucisalibacillus sp. EB02]
MKLKVLFFLSIGIVILSVIYIVNLINQDFVLNKEDEYEDTMTIWITTPGLISSIDGFEEASRIKVHIKQFNNWETLIDELLLSNVEGNLPDIIEVHSSYGLDEVVNIEKPKSNEDIGQELFTSFHGATLENFQYKDELYGYPLGVNLPIIIINRTVLNHHFSEKQFLSPFDSNDSLETYQSIQERINNNNKVRPFWLFHFDKEIPYYWDAYQQTRMDSVTSFEVYWTDLVKKYGLVPPLDEHMAITRFSNMEIGVLITTTSKLQTIQELIGNTFEFEVLPLFENGQPLLVSGNGLVAFGNEEKIKRFYEFLAHDDVQLEILQNTGWIPAMKTSMNNVSFINQLPMAKYLSNLVRENNNFRGQGVSNGRRDIWNRIKEKAQEIEESAE